MESWTRADQEFLSKRSPWLGQTMRNSVVQRLNGEEGSHSKLWMVENWSEEGVSGNVERGRAR